MASCPSPAPLASSITPTTLPWGTPSSAWTTTSVLGFLFLASSSAFFSSSSETTLPPSTSRPSASTATDRSVWVSATSAAWPPLGRFTFSPAFAPPPPWFTITELVTMKMISSTRKMSVSGVMLISEKTPSASPSSLPGTLPSAMASGPFHRPGLDARDGRALGRGAARGAGGRSGAGRQRRLEVVVGDNRLDRDEDACCGGDQRLGDAGHHGGGSAGAAGLDVDAEVLERPHDAGHGAEQAGERRHRADGAEDPEVA